MQDFPQVIKIIDSKHISVCLEHHKMALRDSSSSAIALHMVPYSMHHKFSECTFLESVCHIFHSASVLRFANFVTASNAD